MKVIVKFASKLDVSKWGNPKLAQSMINAIQDKVPDADVKPDSSIYGLFSKKFGMNSKPHINRMAESLSKKLGFEVSSPVGKTFKQWYDDNKASKVGSVIPKSSNSSNSSKSSKPEPPKISKEYQDKLDELNVKIEKRNSDLRVWRYGTDNYNTASADLTKLLKEYKEIETKALMEIKSSSKGIGISKEKLLGMSNTQLLESLGIKNTKLTYQSGKRSTIHDTDTVYLNDNKVFMESLRKAIDKYYTPDSRIEDKQFKFEYPDEEVIRYKKREELEWDRQFGEKTTVILKTGAFKVTIDSMENYY